MKTENLCGTSGNMGVYCAGTPENSACRICDDFGVTGNLFRLISAHQLNPTVVSVRDSAGTVRLETKLSLVYRKSDVSRHCDISHGLMRVTPVGLKSAPLLREPLIVVKVQKHMGGFAPVCDEHRPIVCGPFCLARPLIELAT